MILHTFAPKARDFTLIFFFVCWYVRYTRHFMAFRLLNATRSRTSCSTRPLPVLGELRELCTPAPTHKDTHCWQSSCVSVLVCASSFLVRTQVKICIDCVYCCLRYIVFLRIPDDGCSSTLPLLLVGVPSTRKQLLHLFSYHSVFYIRWNNDSILKS